MKINRYEDISQIEREAKRDYIDRHSAFVHCDATAVKGEKFKVKVKVGEEYKHPDDFDHYISYVQLWDGERMLAQTTPLSRHHGQCSKSGRNRFLHRSRKKPEVDRTSLLHQARIVAEQ